MQQIEIDFQVFKELTARRRSESHTYNEVIRELLDIDEASPTFEEPLTTRISGVLDNAFRTPTSGVSFRHLFLPNGTLLRATHKGSAFGATIMDGKWVNDDGSHSASPSAAAKAITGNNVNGWRFWQAKRPSDTEWRNLDMFPRILT